MNSIKLLCLCAAGSAILGIFGICGCSGSVPLVAGEWSVPSDVGLQTRLVPVTKSIRPGRPLFVKIEVRHENPASRTLATDIIYCSAAEVVVRDGKGEVVDSYNSGLRVLKMVSAGADMCVGVFIVGKVADLDAGLYSVSVIPKFAPEEVECDTDELPAPGPIRFEVLRKAAPAVPESVLKADYEQAEELKVYLNFFNSGLPEELIKQGGRSIMPGLAALIEMREEATYDDAIPLWQYAAFLVGRVNDTNDRRVVPFLTSRLDDKGAMSFYFVDPLGKLKVLQAVPRIVRELNTMDDSSWQNVCSAYLTRANYLVEALERITGRTFPRGDNRWPDKAVALKAVNDWWNSNGKNSYPTK